MNATYEAGFIAESVDDDQIRVVASDSGGVEIGACANRSGGALDTSCWKDSVAPLLRLASLPREEFAPGSGNDIICRLGEGTFGQRSRLVTYSANSSAAAGPAKGEVKITSATYQLVYEWSQSINVYAVPGLLKEHEPVVSSADYGVALRLIMDVSISSADSSLGATLGIAQLAAALQTDRAQINVRYSVLGAVKSFLPDGAIRIDSSADLFQVMADFHAQARTFASQWEALCQPSPAPSSAVAPVVPPVVNAPAVAPVAGPVPPSPPPPRGSSLKPAILSYFVRGEGLGRSLRQRQEAQAKCLELNEEYSALRNKKGVHQEEVWALEDYLEAICARAQERGTHYAFSDAMNAISTAKSSQELEATMTRLEGEIWNDEQWRRIDAAAGAAMKSLKAKATSAQAK